MDVPLNAEKQLLADIEMLRGQFTQTQDLYREACVLLFFRYGITPTANKLYQLVRKGSMSAPTEALNRFWEDLREKSRVRIERPDLPEALKTAAGDLTATLWSTAQAFAQESLAEARQEAQLMAAEAKAATEKADAERDLARQGHDQVCQELDNAKELIRSLEQQLAAASATNTALEAQQRQLKEENAASQQRLEEARRDFANELEKTRADVKTAEDRFRAAEARALLEIDRERTATAKLQRELETTRAASAQAVERARSETSGLQEQIGELRQKVGNLEGNLQAITANRDLALKEAQVLQAKLSETTTQISLHKSETEMWRQQAEELKKEIAAARETGTAARRSKKPKSEVNSPQ